MGGQGRDISRFPEESGGRNRVTTAVNLEGNERDIEAEKRLYICSTLRVHGLLQFSQESEYGKGHLRNSRYVELTACGKFPFGHSICTTSLVICPPSPPPQALRKLILLWCLPLWKMEPFSFPSQRPAMVLPCSYVFPSCPIGLYLLMSLSSISTATSCNLRS